MTIFTAIMNHRHFSEGLAPYDSLFTNHHCAKFSLRMRNCPSGMSGKELGYGVLAGVGAFGASLALYKGVQYIYNRAKQKVKRIANRYFVSVRLVSIA